MVGAVGPKFNAPNGQLSAVLATKRLVGVTSNSDEGTVATFVQCW